MSHSFEDLNGNKSTRFFHGNEKELEDHLNMLAQQSNADKTIRNFTQYKNIHGNDRCPCGSGVRFDLCCKELSVALGKVHEALTPSPSPIEKDA